MALSISLTLRSIVVSSPLPTTSDSSSIPSLISVTNGWAEVESSLDSSLDIFADSRLYLIFSSSVSDCSAFFKYHSARECLMSLFLGCEPRAFRNSSPDFSMLPSAEIISNIASCCNRRGSSPTRSMLVLYTFRTNCGSLRNLISSRAFTSLMKAYLSELYPKSSAPNILRYSSNLACWSTRTRSTTISATIGCRER